MRRGVPWSARRVSLPRYPTYTAGLRLPSGAVAVARLIRPDRNLSLGGGPLRSVHLVVKPGAGIAQLMGEIVERGSGLDVCRVGAGHRAAQPEFLPMGVDPMPDHGRLAAGGGDVEGAATP